MFMMPASRAQRRARAYEVPYQITAGVTGNNLTVTVSPLNGQPAPFLPFRNPSIANGDEYFRSILPGTRFTVNSGNTLGTSNAVPFRLWFVGWDNGGGITPGLINCLTGGGSPTAIFPLDESSLQTVTGGNGGSSAATFYAAQTVTGRPYRVLGYLEWSSGLATAGTWSSAPTKIQVFGPGIKKPGDQVQLAYATSTTQVDSTAVTYATYISGAITPTSAVNPVGVRVSGMGLITSGIAGFWSVFRSATIIQSGAITSGAGGNINLYGSGDVLDRPNTTSSTTYSLQGKSDGTHLIRWPTPGDGGTYATLTMTEYMA